MFPCLHAFVEKANYIHFLWCVRVFLPVKLSTNMPHTFRDITRQSCRKCAFPFAILLLVPIKSTKEDVICSRLEIFHHIITSAFPSQWKGRRRQCSRAEGSPGPFHFNGSLNHFWPQWPTSGLLCHRSLIEENCRPSLLACTLNQWDAILTIKLMGHMMHLLIKDWFGLLMIFYSLF